jgi:hypothetical protein
MTAKRFTNPFAKRSCLHKWRQPLNPTVGFHFLLRPTSDEEPTGSRANDREAVHQPLREAKLSAQVAQPLNPTVGFHFFNRIHSDEERGSQTDRFACE